MPSLNEISYLIFVLSYNVFWQNNAAALFPKDRERASFRKLKIKVKLMCVSERSDRCIPERSVSYVSKMVLFKNVLGIL